MTRPLDRHRVPTPTEADALERAASPAGPLVDFEIGSGRSVWTTRGEALHALREERGHRWSAPKNIVATMVTLGWLSKTDIRHEQRRAITEAGRVALKKARPPAATVDGDEQERCPVAVG